MPKITDLARTVQVPYQKFIYLKSKGDKRISYKKDGELDFLKTVILFALTPELKDGFKLCKVCSCIKHKSEFYRRELTCKSCHSEKQKDIHRKKRIKEVDIYWPDHEPGICAICGATPDEKKFSKRHGDYAKICNPCKWKREKENHTEEYREKRRLKERTDNKTRLNKLIRNGIGKDLKSRASSKSKKSWSELVDYSVEDLEKHLKKSLRKLNKERGTKYNWDDFLNADLHIDHIFPIASFDYDSAEHPEFKRCWALENLQLLPARENISKSDKCESFQIAF